MISSTVRDYGLNPELKKCSIGPHESAAKQHLNQFRRFGRFTFLGLPFTQPKSYMLHRSYPSRGDLDPN